MREKPSNELFEEIRENIFPICIDYGRKILEEALPLPEMHKSLQRHDRSFTPIVEKYRMDIMRDIRLIKAMPLFQKLNFFEKFGGKTILLEYYVFEISPINILLLLLEYILKNPYRNLFILRYQRDWGRQDPSDNEIDELNKKSLILAIDLLKDLLFSPSIKYTVNSILYGFKGKFKTVQIGEYILSTRNISLDSNTDGQPEEMNLLNITKSIDMMLDNIIFDTKKEAEEKGMQLLNFLRDDPSTEFTVFIGFMYVCLQLQSGNVSLSSPEGYRGTFLGSLGTFSANNELVPYSLKHAKLLGIALASMLDGIGLLSDEAFKVFHEIWNTYFDAHIKSGDNIKVALDRLGRSAVRHMPEDKLIELVIGFESLIGAKPRHRSNKDAIGVRTTLLIKDRSDSYEIIDEAYRTRNKLMHTGRADVKTDKLYSLIDRMTLLIENAITHYVELYKNKNFKDELAIVNYLDNILYQEAKKVIHGVNTDDN
jgi:hypothetical protein